MAKENTTAYIIMGLLNHEDLSGYEIKKRIDGGISYFWNAGYGQIYPTLDNLEKEGYINKREERDTKGPKKYVFSLADKGKDKLKEWLAKPEDKEYTKYEILLKLFFGSLAATEDNIKRIKEFQGRQKQNYETMELFKEELKKILGVSNDHLYFYLTILFGEKIYKAYLDWAEEAVNLLEKHKQEEL